MTTTLSKLCISRSALTRANFSSPFSQKNIQECRCGTQNCRGVLGPKPKKPVEDRSMTSAIIAGTKRKFQDIMGSMAHRGMSEDKQMSPKKRKLYANAATTKAKNAGVQSTVARERAERDAAEHSRQIASRQTRALKRSTPITNSRRQNSKNLRNNLPTIKSTRTTTVSFQRKVPKSGALKAVKQPSRFRVISRNTKAALGSSKKSEAHDRPSTPPRSSHALQSGSDEDNSPNITPASLRSASKKLRPSFEAKPSSKGKNRTEKNRPLRTYATGGSRMHQRTVKSASEDPSQTDVETGNSVETAQSKSRNSSVRCVKL
jgi:palmitoyltransferase ZDHHC9/14/18